MDDDDDVPPLEATRRKPDAKQEEGINGKRGEKSERTVDPTDGADGQEAVEERNEVAEAMMQRALAAREQKRKETDESRRKVDGFGGGLKKGFLSSKPQAGNRVWIATESLTSHCSRSLGTRCCMDFFVSVCVAISIAVPFCSKSGILALTCDRQSKPKTEKRTSNQKMLKKPKRPERSWKHLLLPYDEARCNQRAWIAGSLHRGRWFQRGLGYWQGLSRPKVFFPPCQRFVGIWNEQKQMLSVVLRTQNWCVVYGNYIILYRYIHIQFCVFRCPLLISIWVPRKDAKRMSLQMPEAACTAVHCSTGIQNHPDTERVANLFRSVAFCGRFSKLCREWRSWSRIRHIVQQSQDVQVCFFLEIRHKILAFRFSHCFQSLLMLWRARLMAFCQAVLVQHLQFRSEIASSSPSLTRKQSAGAMKIHESRESCGVAFGPFETVLLIASHIFARAVVRAVRFWPMLALRIEMCWTHLGSFASRGWRLSWWLLCNPAQSCWRHQDHVSPVSVPIKSWSGNSVNIRSLLMYADVCWYPCWSGRNCFENGELHRNADPLVPSLCLLLPCLILSHLVSSCIVFPMSSCVELCSVSLGSQDSGGPCSRARCSVHECIMNASWMLCGSLDNSKI